VAFAAKDYAAGGKQRQVRLSAEEFLRRWVQHVLPPGFMKVRHYGVLANRGRAERLAVCRALLALAALARLVRPGAGLADEAGRGPEGCPACGSGLWRRVAALPPAAVGGEERASPGVGGPDTS